MQSIRVSLSCAEAHSILVLTQNGSFPNRRVAKSASDKIRDALVRSSFDPDVFVEIECTADEAVFVEHARQG